METLCKTIKDLFPRAVSLPSCDEYPATTVQPFGPEECLNQMFEGQVWNGLQFYNLSL